MRPDFRRKETPARAPAGRRSAFRFTQAKLVLAILVLATGIRPALAVPAFAEQTQMACQSCHIGGFGPQLTPFGRQFKLNGYTMRASKFTMPVSAMVVASFLRTDKDQPGAPAPHYATNDNATIDEISLFLAGGDGDHLGGFAQITYDGVGRGVSWDNLDLRAIDHVTLFGSDVLLGISVNNNPTTQDVWATLPGWGFPFTDSALAPGPSASTLISDALAQNVIGVSAYAWWDENFYTEVGLYNSTSTGFLKAVGVDPADTSELKSTAPYVRVAYQKDYGDQNFEIGAFGLFADLYPGRDSSTGQSDHYTDLGLDASYQYLGDGQNIYTLNGRFISEHQKLNASVLLGNALSSSVNFNELNANASYYFQNTYGVSVGAFHTWGSSDALLYADNRTLKPNSSGFTFQIDGTPFGGENAEYGPRVNVRMGIQYTAYTMFDGASTNYDGLGRNASDNNTLRIFLWTAF